MAMISAFTTVDKTAHNSRKFAFTLSPTNYGYWKTMIEPFLITNNLMGYVDGSIPCPSKTLSVTDGATVPKENPNYPIWVSNDAHAYAPHSTSREYTLKTQLLRIEMHNDETPDAYLNRVQEYADALAAISEPIKDKDLVMLAVSVSHLSPTSQTSPESSNGQPSPVSTTSIPTPPQPTPPPPPPPPLITRKRLVNLYQNPKQRVPYNPSVNHATVLPTIITEPTSFTIANNSSKWRQAIKEEYDALMKNGTWSLVPRAST
ncbi:retrovirus-related pol polyprotein from transposon TNT 1-94, partial [Tanacetum coccineum]